MKDRLEPPPSTLPPGSTVWCYLRDSGGPTQDRSVDQQKKIIEEYCKEYGLVLSHAPFEDVHRSGGTVEKRDAFAELMSLTANEGLRPRGLLIWNYARFSRGGPYEAQLYKGTLRLRKIVIHSLTDKIPEGEYGAVIETIIDIANKQKKDEAALGAWRGLRSLVQQGAVPGTPPVGFRKVPIKTTSAGGVERTAHKWEPDPAYRKRIRKAFVMKAAGRTLKEIHEATRLYSSLNTYVSFFKNHLYVGTLVYGDLIYENYCKPTIPKDLFDNVQVLLKKAAHQQKITSENHPRRANSQYILSGILYCGRCGFAMHGYSTPQKYGGDYLRYRCGNEKNKKQCTQKPIPSKYVDELVMRKVREHLEHPETVIQMLSILQEEQKDAHVRVEEKVSLLTSELSAIRKSISNLTNAIAARGHSAALISKLTEYEAQENNVLVRIEQAKAELSEPIVIPTLEQAQAVSNSLLEALQNKDPGIIRQVLTSQLGKVIIDRKEQHLHARLEFFVSKKKLCL